MSAGFTGAIGAGGTRFRQGIGRFNLARLEANRQRRQTQGRGVISGAAGGFSDMGQGILQIGDSATDAADRYVEQMQRIREANAAVREDIEVDMVRAVGSLASSVAVDLSDGLASGSLSFEKLGSSALKSLTQMAKGIGATYIATGTPLLIPGPLFNPAAGGMYLKAGGLLLGGATIAGALGNLGGGGGGGGRAAVAPASRAELNAGGRSMASGGAPQVTRVYDFNGATIVANDPDAFRRTADELDRTRDLGGSGI